jgi:hypothetical protein
MLSLSERRRVSAWLGEGEDCHHEYADFFLKALGAAQLNAIDASRYEGAEIIHNLNGELPEPLHQRFSCLIDGGTLEHVFDIRQSLKSCMQMVKVGGHRVKFMALNEDGRWYEPLPPQQVGERIQARTSAETFIFVLAERISDVVPFAVSPHQTDYVSNLDVAQHVGSAAARNGTGVSPLKVLRKRLGDIKRRHVYRTFPWLGRLEEEYSRHRYLRLDRLSNPRRFRTIGKRLLVGTMGFVAAPIHALLEFDFGVTCFVG